MKRLRDTPVRMQILFIILLTGLLPIIALGIFSYRTYVAELTEKMDVMAASVSRQSRDKLDRLLGSVKDYYSGLYNTPSVRWLIENGQGGLVSAEVLAAADELRGGPSFIENISAYTFISLDDDWVLSNRGMYRLRDAVNLAEFERLRAETEASGNRALWVNRAGVSEPPTRSRDIDLSGYILMLRFPIIGVSTDSVLLVNLVTSQLYGLVTENIGPYDVAVLDLAGGLLFSTSPLLGDHCVENYESLLSLTPQQAELEGIRYRTVSAVSNSSNLMIVTGYGMDAVDEGADRILALVAVLLAIVVSIVILGFLGSSWIYRPVSRMIKSMGHSAPGRSGNEFHLIEDEVRRLIDNRDSALMELFVLRLIQGKISSGQTGAYKERLGLPARELYCMAAVHFDSGAEKLSRPEDDAAQYLILNGVPQEIKSLLYLPPAAGGAYANVFILADDSRQRLRERCGRLAESLGRYAAEEYGSVAFLGISSFAPELVMLRGAYYESLEALKSSLYLHSASPAGASVFFEDMVPGRQNAFLYDAYLEHEMQEALGDCDFERASACSDAFLGALDASRCAQHERSMHLGRFLLCILRELSESSGLSVNEVYRDEPVNIFESVNQIYDTEELRLFFSLQIIKPCIRAIEELRDKPSPEIYTRVRGLVAEKKGDISLTECAEQLGYHPSHVWKILKAHNNMTFSDFVAEEKLAMAKDMLANTALTVTEIAETLNYTNTQNFIRFFRKKEGVSPGKYRSR